MLGSFRLRYIAKSDKVAVETVSYIALALVCDQSSILYHIGATDSTATYSGGGNILGWYRISAMS